ncbi:hypothetical protein DEA98_25860 [Brucella pseudogrignonensis]|nr:hypothetical protein [Brucella pseudogrignonensis]
MHINESTLVQERMYKMPFNINDPTVDALLDQIMKQSGVRTKVGAIRMALQHEADRLGHQTPLRDKLAAIRAKKGGSWVQLFLT